MHFVGFQAVQSSEHMGSHIVFALLQLYTLVAWVRTFITPDQVTQLFLSPSLAPISNESVIFMFCINKVHTIRETVVDSCRRVVRGCVLCRHAHWLHCAVDGSFLFAYGPNVRKKECFCFVVLAVRFLCLIDFALFLFFVCLFVFCSFFNSTNRWMR